MDTLGIRRDTDAVFCLLESCRLLVLFFSKDLSWGGWSYVPCHSSQPSPAVQKLTMDRDQPPRAPLEVAGLFPRSAQSSGWDLIRGYIGF